MNVRRGITLPMAVVHCCPLLTLIALVAFPYLTLAAPRFLSPLPPDTKPCLTLISDDFGVNVLGYITDPDGTTTITFAVNNKGETDVSYLAFSTLTWPPLEPGNGITYTAGLGNYTVVWTDSEDEPGFPSVKYTPLFAGYRKGQQDTLALRVAHFDPNAVLTVQIGAGQTVAAVTFTLADTACNFTPPIPTVAPTSTPALPLPTPTARPLDEIGPVEAYVISAADLATPLSEAAKIAHWQHGLPVPFTELISDTNVGGAVNSLVDKPGLLAPVPMAMAQSNPPVVIDPWQDWEREDFEATFPNTDGQCSWSVTPTAQPSWGITQTQVRGRTRNVLWPGGAELAPSAYPNNVQTTMICILNNMSTTVSVLAEFELFFHLADNGDRIAVSFYDGEMAPDQGEIWRGLEWRGAYLNAATVLPTLYRVYLPELTGNSVVKIRWQFSSNGSGNAAGPWLDNLKVAGYRKPTAGADCPGLATANRFAIADVDGNRVQVSKSLNVPPYNEHFRSDLGRDLDPAMVTNVAQWADADWVRLEFQAVSKPLPLAVNQTTQNYITIDLRHFDTMIESLCAQGVAILGLVDYRSVANQAWKGALPNAPDDNQISADYQQLLLRALRLLIERYKERIRYWEIWNEPDFRPLDGRDTYLPPADFADLLFAARQLMQGADPAAKLVSGGLGGITNDASAYFREFYQSVQSFPDSAYDVLALHPYPFKIAGQNWRDPKVYLRYGLLADERTRLDRFQKMVTLARDQGKPIWVTELGWNSAQGEPTCGGYGEDFVTRAEQMAYLVDSFDLLFKESAWRSGGAFLAPGVTNIFWYQYHDTAFGVNCAAQKGPAPAFRSPSAYNPWPGSRTAAAATSLIPWHFGLFDGNLQPKSTWCAFGAYPQRCSSVYLPIITASAR